jgi:predicted aldo/keto reductase-like oxidoreductase
MSERDMNRRQMLSRVGATGGGLVLASTLGVGPREVAAAPVQVPRRVLGKTGEKIPILVMGGSMPLDLRFDPKLAEGLRYGVNYFDTAAGYTGGNSERALGAFHTRANLRKKMWITTKSSDHDPPGVEASLARSFERLQTDQVEMLFLHGLKDPKAINDELRATVERLRKEKKIRFFGFSCHNGNVAELLELASKTPWIDAVMFRYNFQQYGNVELNRAMDAAAKAKVGLIAMKTQSSAVSFEERSKKFEQTGKWNKFQAVLKAVWADDRLTAAVSEMDNLDKVRENVGAAVDKTKLTSAEWEALWRYAAATRSSTCDGCDHLCGAALDAPVDIAATLRYLMYHDSYGKRDRARELFRELPAEARSFSHLDFSAARAACPHGVDLDRLMRRAAQVLA